MEGIFILEKTRARFLLFVGMIVMGEWVYLFFVKGRAFQHTLILFCFGILLLLVAVTLLSLNHKAYLFLNGTSLQAKYHWFGHLDCSLEEISFVLPQINTLTILLKSGKQHTIAGIENSYALSSVIRRQIFSAEIETVPNLQKELASVQNLRKSELKKTLLGTALLFANICICVFITGGRDLSEFSKTDWILFSIMCFIELLTVVGTFWVASRCGKLLLPIEHLKFRLRGAMFVTTPSAAANIINIYVDENLTERIVVYSFPQDEGRYFCVDQINGNFELQRVYTSELFPEHVKLDFSSHIMIMSKDFGC